MKRWIVGALCAVLLLCAGCKIEERSDEAKTNAPAEKREAIVSSEEMVNEKMEDKATESEETEKKAGKFQVSDFTCNDDSREIFGRLFVPECEEKMPLVILCHGMNATYSSMQYLAMELASRGMISYAFDFCGGAISSASSGSMAEMSVMTEREDLELVLETLLKELENVDPDQVYLCGWSMGGYVSTMLAAERPEMVRSLFLLAPAFYIDEYVRSCFTSYESIPDELEEDGGLPVSGKFYRDPWDYQIYEEMKNYTGPVHIYHGDRDSDVPVAYSQYAAAIFPDAELTVMEGATHIFTSEEFKFLAGEIEAIVFESNVEEETARN